MKTTVMVSFQMEGLHSWPNAKNVFPDVAFLSDPHRHMFHFKLSKLVTHTDRDIEFIRWKREIEAFLMKKYGRVGMISPFPLQFVSNSCEMLATELLNEFDCEWVECWEDGENGARVEK